LDKLADFFLKGHFVEKLVNLLFEVGLREGRAGRAGVGSLLRGRSRRRRERVKQENEGCYS
jgi:hypothetical protein